MPKRVTSPPLALPPLDPTALLPLHRQLYAALREAILTRQLAPGARLPSSRTLASELRVARTTVVVAFEQLHAEGFVVGRVGAGTRVAGDIVSGRTRSHRVPADAAPQLSRRGTAIAATASAANLGLAAGLFHPGLPAVDAFPTATWAQLANRRLRGPTADLLAYGDTAGYLPLREAIADYLGSARAVRCTPEQVIIVNGAQQAIDLIARLLLDPGDTVWIEEPGYSGAQGALRAAGARLVPVPVDSEGLLVATGIASAPAARLAYVTPSHQFPLGATLSLARRLELLAWAQQAGSWIVVDDYDSEYRFVGRPLAALQGLDTAGRVLYLGTFSKVLSPALRLGYLVAPPSLVEAFLAARKLIDRHPPLLEQAVLADFMAAGHFARHLRRVRDLAAERQGALIEAMRETFGEAIATAAHPAGLHLVGDLPAGIDDRRASQLARAAGIMAPPLSTSFLAPTDRRGLLLGYASAPPAALRDATRRLGRALAPLLHPTTRRRG